MAAKGPIRETGTALIVEGYMDLLSLHQEGFRNVVASLGTALTQAQVALLARQAREAVVVFDADESGRKAAQRSLELFLAEGLSAKVASLPAGFDPDSYVRREKAEGFRRILGEAVPVVDYMLQQAIRRHGTQTVEGKVRIVREILPALNRLADPLEQNLYVEQIAQRLGLKEAQLRESLSRREPLAKADAGPVRAAAPPGPLHERILLQLILLYPRFIPEAREIVEADGLSDVRYRRVAREALAYAKANPQGDISGLLLNLEEEAKNLVAELLLEEERVVDPDRMFRDCLGKMQATRVLREIQQVDEEIRQRSLLAKENPAGASGLKELLKRKQRLVLEQKKWMGRSSAGDSAAEA
jgi:DNA primase